MLSPACTVVRHTLEPRSARLITPWTDTPSLFLLLLLPLLLFSRRLEDGVWLPAAARAVFAAVMGLLGGNLLRGHSIPLARGIPMISPAQPGRREFHKDVAWQHKHILHHRDGCRQWMFPGTASTSSGIYFITKLTFPGGTADGYKLS